MRVSSTVLVIKANLLFEHGFTFAIISPTYACHRSEQEHDAQITGQMANVAIAAIIGYNGTLSQPQRVRLHRLLRNVSCFIALLTLLFYNQKVHKSTI
jgi:hypothetical protein